MNHIFQYHLLLKFHYCFHLISLCKEIRVALHLMNTIEYIKNDNKIDVFDREHIVKYNLNEWHNKLQSRKLFRFNGVSIMD